MAFMIKSTSPFHFSLEKESNLTGTRRIGKALPPIGRKQKSREILLYL